MPRPRSTLRCRECGQAIIQSGRARQWVHVDQFHQRLGHTPQPAGAREAAPSRTARVTRSDSGAQDTSAAQRLLGALRGQPPAPPGGQDSQTRLLRMLESRRRGGAPGGEQ